MLVFFLSKHFIASEIFLLGTYKTITKIVAIRKSQYFSLVYFKWYKNDLVKFSFRNIIIYQVN